MAGSPPLSVQRKRGTGRTVPFLTEIIFSKSSAILVFSTMKAKSILLLMFGAACMLTAKADRFSTLAGKWTYRLDSLSLGEPQQWFTQRFQ